MEVSIFYNNLLDSMEAKGNLDFYFGRLEHPIDSDYDDGEEIKVKGRMPCGLAIIDVSTGDSFVVPLVDSAENFPLTPLQIVWGNIY
ncbi:hypothetical protein QYF36_000287 [Acer negundo]|nr:hypothetical protein QYF36_000287 [Acer negundo]